MAQPCTWRAKQFAAFSFNTTSVETDTPIRLYTSRLLTQQGLLPLSLDHLALEMLRIIPFLARGFGDTN